MTALLRAKYAQHPQLAQTLLASGDAGKLLHVIRSELAAAAAGIMPSGSY